MTSTLPATLAEYTDLELREFYLNSDGESWHSFIEAEMQRRDDEQAAAKARRAASAEYHVSGPGAACYEAAHAQYLAAERECAGRLLSAEGFAETSEPMTLWTGTDKWARRLASEELRNFWEAHPRLTPSEYHRQASGERRNWLDRHDREAASDHVDRDAPAAVRRIASQGEGSARARADGRGVTVPGSPAGRGAAQDRAGTGAAARPGGPVRRGSGMSETLPTTEQRDRLRRRAAELQQIAAQASPGDTVAGEREPGEVIESGERERPSTDLVAVREGTVVYDSDPPERIDGAELLGHIARYLGTYIAFPTVAAHVTVSLWNAHAASRDRNDEGIGPLIWRATPRLGLTSSDNKSGKSTVLDLSGMLQRVQRPTKITGRSIAHKLGRKHEAVMLDEVKVLFGAGAASKDVQSVLLAGYTPRATWDYARGNADVSIPCFGPVAYAAKDELITATGEQLIDLFDRTIWIRMKRPPALMPQPDEQAEDDGRLLGESLADWTSSVKGELKARSRELARLDYEASQEAAEEGVEVDGRTPQIWRPLLAVADVAGGPWPALARQAMRELTQGAAKTEAVGRMGDLRKMSQRWAPVGFLDSPAPVSPGTDDYDEKEEDDWS